MPSIVGLIDLTNTRICCSLFLIGFIGVFTVSCRKLKHDLPDQRLDHGTTQEYLVGGTLWTQNSAEWRALCYQAYGWAERRLEEELVELASSPVGEMAIVTDLDETVLDNSAYMAWQIEQDVPYNPETWAHWTALAEAPAVPGARRFLRLADSLGVTIFYVSNRKVEEREATMRNMEALGLPQVDTAHFLLKTSTSDKTERRERIEAMGYEVLLYLGDNLGDFDGRWDKQSTAVRAEEADAARDAFGDRWIVFPNPLYGTWEGAIYGYDWGLSPEQRDSARWAHLRPAVMPDVR
jgi:5'-nucleotidase (lipoprotein e(P4) family)